MEKQTVSSRIYFNLWVLPCSSAQSADAVEYTDCIPAEG